MYQVVRSLPLPSDVTKMILDYIGKTNIAKMIEKYFKYPLSRIDLDEWSFPQYSYSVWSVNETHYFNELAIESFHWEHDRQVLELDSVADLENIDWDVVNVVSHQDAINCEYQNYPTLTEEHQYYEDNGLGIFFMEFNYYWDGIAVFAYTRTDLFAV